MEIYHFRYYETGTLTTPTPHPGRRGSWRRAPGWPPPRSATGSRTGGRETGLRRHRGKYLYLIKYHHICYEWVPMMIIGRSEMDKYGTSYLILLDWHFSCISITTFSNWIIIPQYPWENPESWPPQTRKTFRAQLAVGVSSDWLVCCDVNLLVVVAMQCSTVQCDIYCDILINLSHFLPRPPAPGLNQNLVI